MFRLQVDADSECFGDAFSRRVMRAVVGFEDVVMASLRALAQNSSEDGMYICRVSVVFVRHVCINSVFFFSFA